MSSPQTDSMQTQTPTLTICAANVEYLIELRREIEEYGRQIRALFQAPVYDPVAHDRLRDKREFALHALIGALDGSGLGALWKERA